LKIRGLKEKDLLKKVFRGVLPEVILNRPKHPYRAPIQQSLLNGSGDGSADSLSSESLAAAGLFDGNKVEKLLNKLRKTNHATEVEGMALAGILSTQLLFRQFGTAFKCNLPHGVVPTVFVDRRTAA
jgi:asparagine synthase (glutamine-hydrolysing)